MCRKSVDTYKTPAANVSSNGILLPNMACLAKVKNVRWHKFFSRNIQAVKVLNSYHLFVITLKYQTIESQSCQSNVSFQFEYFSELRVTPLRY